MTRNVFAFANCVYDLEDLITRQIRPDDYIIFQSKYDYMPFDVSNPNIQEVLVFMRSILPDVETCDYALKTFSTSLSKDILHRFFVCTGEGLNGKSLLFKLLSKALGPSYVNFSPSLLCCKSIAEYNQEELGTLRNKRLIAFHDPAGYQEIQVEILKMLCSGDPISATYQLDRFEFTPQFKCFLVCNTIPMTNEHTECIRVINFPMSFVNSPNSENPFEAKRDPTLESRLLGLGREVLSVLLHYYERYKKEGLIEPRGVLEHTAEYLEFVRLNARR